MLQRLPFEVELEIIEYVDVRDIISLQLTCKSLYNLIEGHSKLIWRRCLKRQCVENGLFWPTYKDLSTAAEYKHASILPILSSRAYQSATKKGKEIPHTVTKLAFPPDHSLAALEDIYLVPGGRYLLTFEKGWMAVWDLNPPGEQLKPKEMMHHWVGPFDNLVCINMVDNGKLHVVLSFTGEEQPVTSSDSTIFVCISTYEFFEIEVSDEGAFEVRSLSRFCIVHLGEEFVNVYTVLGGKVTFHVNGKDFDTTLVWDYVRNGYAGWKLGGITDICEVFSSDGHVFYINEEGLHAAKIPPLKPNDIGGVLLRVLAQDVLVPTSFYSYGVKYDIASAEQVIGGDLRWGILEDEPLIFQIKEHIDGMLRIHRYQFKFDATDDQKGSLKLLETSECNMTEYKNLASRPYQVCDNRLAMIWAEEVVEFDWHVSQLFLSLSSPVVDGPAAAVELEKRERKELRLIPFGAHIELAKSAHAYEFCAATGKAAILWSSEDPDTGLVAETWINYYDFLASP